MLKYLISLIKCELKIQTPYKMSFFITTAKTPFLNSLLISLYYKFVKGVFYTKPNISAGGDWLINMPIEVRWFSIIGFLVIGYF